MTDDMPSPFQPAPPPVSPSAVERPPRKSSKKAAKKPRAAKKATTPKIDYAGEAAKRTAIEKPAKKPRKKRKVKIALPAGSMAFYERTGKLIASIAEHTGADPDTVVKIFRKLMPE